MEKFPGSPRVNVLIGIRKEASLPAESALAYYDELLEDDESNAVSSFPNVSQVAQALTAFFTQAAWKRKVTVLRRMGNITKAVEELSRLLDTLYTDVEGWVELADIYSSCNQ